MLIKSIFLRPIFLTGFCCGCLMNAYTQISDSKAPFTIYYLRGKIGMEDSLHISSLQKVEKKTPFAWGQITVAGSVSYHIPLRKKDEKINEVLGSTLRSHARYIDLSRQVNIWQSEPGGTRERYLISDTLKTPQWKFTGVTIVILGFVCEQAIEETKTSTYVTWFTRELPYPFSHNGYTGLPGMVLASEYFYNGNRMVSIAESITPETRSIVQPKEGIPVTLQEFQMILSRLQSKF